MLSLADSVLGEAVNSRIQSIESDRGWLQIARAVIETGLTIAATVFLSPLGGALVGGVFGAIHVAEGVARNTVEDDASNVDLDPALADISQGEEEYLWLIIDIVGLGIDVFGVLRALRPAATALRTAEDLAEFAAAARRALPEDQAAQLIARANRRLGLRPVGDVVEESATEVRSARSFPTPDGLHTIKLLPDGSLIRCSPVCARLRAFYRELLTASGKTPEQARLAQRLENLTRLARSSNTSIAERAAREAAELEPQLRATASQFLGESLGLADDVADPFLRLFPMAQVRSMEPLLRQLGGKPLAVRNSLRRAMELSDDVGRADIIEVLRQNMRGGAGLSNAQFAEAMEQTVAFLERYGSRVEGNLASRFARTLQRNTAQAARAQGEIRLIEDVLEGRTAFGRNRTVSGLAESTVQGVQTPEIGVRLGDVTQLAEVKMIGVPDVGQVARPVSREQLQRGLRAALEQIHGRLEPGTAGGLVRLDARLGGPLAISEGQLRAMVRGRVLMPGHEARVRWIEVFFNDSNGRMQRALYEVVGRRLIRSGL